MCFASSLWLAHARLVGLPASFRTGGAGSSAASALGMVTVTLRSIAVASASTKPKQQRLPTTMKVGSLKMLCARLFKVSASATVCGSGSLRPAFRVLFVSRKKHDRLLLQQVPAAAVELVYQEPDSLSIPQALEDDDVSLAYYGVFDGGVIVVHNANDNKKKGV